MRFLPLLPALLVLAGTSACKKTDGSAREAIARMSEFREKMCACKDRACGEKVQEEMARWSEEMARKAGDKRPEPLSEEGSKRYTADVTQMAQCAQRVFSIDQEPTPPPVDAAAPPPPPAPEKVTNADRMIRLTYDSLGDLAVQGLEIRYVRADGTLDDEYGEAMFALGMPKPPDPADDPARPLGAPIRKAPPPAYAPGSSCPRHWWKHGTRTSENIPCVMKGPALPRPKCSVVEVWKRAIEKDAPEQGLAVLVLHGHPTQRWSFAIDDEPRRVHVAFEIEDSCEPTLEKPR